MINAKGSSLEVRGFTKRFGALLALDDVSLKLAPGTFHALLGGNGAGKSTLVKSIMGFYRPDAGTVHLDGRPLEISGPREAIDYGIGMVYQHFTLVGNMTVAENLVLARSSVPARIHWSRELADLKAFIESTPFRMDLEAPVRTLAAGQKQRLEILKQLYLKNRILFLDEPTSVLTPQEADEALGLLRAMATRGELSVLIITHKFREVLKFCDHLTILRNGRRVGGGMCRDFTPAQMADLMIGSESQARMAERNCEPRGAVRLEISSLEARDETGAPVLRGLDAKVHGGEILGIAGVSGNGQSALLETLAGQRIPTAGGMQVEGRVYRADRRAAQALKMVCLPEEPLRNACVPAMSVAENMSLRAFDQAPGCGRLGRLRFGVLQEMARQLVGRYRVKTPSIHTPIRELSGGNVQRAVLARELSDDVLVLVIQNPCFGLDFAATASTRAQILQARNRGAAVLLISEDLDEIFELSDRIAVMFEGRIVHETLRHEADINRIGGYMAGHHG